MKYLNKLKRSLGSLRAYLFAPYVVIEFEPDGDGGLAVSNHQYAWDYADALDWLSRFGRNTAVHYNAFGTVADYVAGRQYDEVTVFNAWEV